VRKTTFSNAKRFIDPKLNYTQECSDRSLIDAERLLNQNSPNKIHEWEKSTGRGFLFLDRD